MINSNEYKLTQNFTFGLVKNTNFTFSLLNLSGFNAPTGFVKSRKVAGEVKSATQVVR